MASIIKRCDWDGWNECPHSWIVRYRTAGGRSSRQREWFFGGDPSETATQSMILTIFEGTSEIQQMIIGRAVTGLDVR